MVLSYKENVVLHEKTRLNVVLHEEKTTSFCHNRTCQASFIKQQKMNQYIEKIVRQFWNGLKKDQHSCQRKRYNTTNT